jgi:GcrA cell cycle regulator
MNATQHVRIPDQVADASLGGTWTTERVEMLRNYVNAGLTCWQIAQEIGVTRNAVIGKLNRLGLKGPQAARLRGPRSMQPRPSRAFSQRQILHTIYADTPFAAEATEPAIVSTNPCTLIELTGCTCRWPLGDADAKDFSFCGNPVVASFPYCAGHVRMAYRTPSQRRAQAG